jgi:YHS domain-containing protein
LAVKEEIAGRQVYFCRCPHCLDAFREKPDHYINRLAWS